MNNGNGYWTARKRGALSLVLVVVPLFLIGGTLGETAPALALAMPPQTNDSGGYGLRLGARIAVVIVVVIVLLLLS